MHSPEGCLIEMDAPAWVTRCTIEKIFFKWWFLYVIKDGISSPTQGNCLKLVPEHLQFSLEKQQRQPSPGMPEVPGLVSG